MDFPIEDIIADDNFGTDAIYTPASGDSKIVRVHFQQNSHPVDIGRQGVDSTTVEAVAKTADVADVDLNSTLKVGDTTWKVSQIHEMFAQVTELSLSKQ